MMFYGSMMIGIGISLMIGTPSTFFFAGSPLLLIINSISDSKRISWHHWRQNHGDSPNIPEVLDDP